MTNSTGRVSELRAALKRCGVDASMEVPSPSGIPVMTFEARSILRAVPRSVRLVLFPENEPFFRGAGATSIRKFLYKELSLGENVLAIILGDFPLTTEQDLPRYWALYSYRHFLEALKYESVAKLRDLLLKRWPLEAINPYQTFTAVESDMFFGRDYDTRDLSKVQSNFIVLGPRRCGKSSLARNVHQRLHTDTSLRLSLGARGSGKYLYSCSLVDVEGLMHLDGLWEAILRSMGLEQRDLKGGMSMKLVLGPGTVEEKTPYELLTHLVVHKYRRALILLDEVDGAIRADKKNGWPLFKRLRALLDCSNARVALFGYHELYRAMNSVEFPLQGRCTRKMLANLGIDDVRAIIETPMTELGIHFDSAGETTSAIYKATGGMPNLVQDICHLLVSRISGMDEEVVTLPLVEEVVNALQPVERIHAAFMAMEEPLPRLIVYLAAPEKQVNAGALLQRLRAEYKLDVDDGQVAAALDYLYLYNVLQKAGRAGEYSFASEMLHERISRDVADPYHDTVIDALVGKVRWDVGELS